ncbi:MAG: acetyltransferase [Chitinophagales bacterium]|nr:acetyltransferase [Bacteroidota bacterium]
MKEDYSTIYIYGSGAQGRVARDILVCAYPKAQLFFVDENPELWNTRINDTLVINAEELYKLSEIPNVHIAIGNPNTRERLYNKLYQAKINIVSAVHPSASILPTAKYDVGCTIGAQAVVNTNATIGKCCLINTGAIIEHDTQMEDFASVSPGATIGGRVFLGKKSFVASKAVVVARARIGASAVVGMGSVVTKDVNDYELVYGVPAKLQSKIDANFDWRKLF